MSVLAFDEAGRLPAAGDNVAIAVRTLEAGIRVRMTANDFALTHTVLEGHRFVVEPIARGCPLLSWGLPFGLALCNLRPGEYACNASILQALRSRHVRFPLPPAPNFSNYRIPVALDPAAFRPGAQVPRHGEARFFDGYRRPAGRGVGTRNYIVVIGIDSLAGPFARVLAERFRDSAGGSLDGVVAVAHTEGDGSELTHNGAQLLRALAGFMVHPNVAAVLMVDSGAGAIDWRAVRQFALEQGYPLDAVEHRSLLLGGAFEASLEEGGRILRGWIGPAAGAPRTRESIEALRIALQCGGSDAFSGVSGNPLVGWLSRELLRYGGSANLAETDELIGAEPYMLGNVRDLETARAFLRLTESFQERARWHGTSAEGNPSGGNMFRGLYNITVKSIGAARKKDPAVRLDYVIDYGERMSAPGYYLMDSPGNDLESVAGQVASGCTLILFTTGNGSITNFPFVPTLKIMTNSGRFNLLAREMDINAGRYLDGAPMDELGRESFEQMIRAACGERTAGERGGHAQVQLWRNWRQAEDSRIRAWPARRRPGRESGVVAAAAEPRDLEVLRQSIPGVRREGTFALRRLNLIAPTSLCASQVARLIAAELNAGAAGGRGGLRVAPQYVALPHTEGCGVGGVENEDIQLRILSGYLLHPNVERALLLEHGCEKTHHDALRNHLSANQNDPAQFGWASIQLDGGVESVRAKIGEWFAARLAITGEVAEGFLSELRYGFVCYDCAGALLVAGCSRLIRALAHSGASVVLPWFESTAAAGDGRGIASLPDLEFPERPSLDFGARCTEPGLHWMDAPTRQPVEILTGLGAAGLDVMIVCGSPRPLPAHPFIPVLQVTDAASAAERAGDFDLVLPQTAAAEDWIAALVGRICAVARGKLQPRMLAAGNVDFQITRGLFGFSL